MRSKGTYVVYGLLVSLWLLIATWQIVDHIRVRQAERASLYQRARDISNTVSVIIRSQRFFVPQTRLEAGLQLLAGSQDLRSVALLNSSGEIVASGGEPISGVLEDFPERVDRWDTHTLTIVNPIDLGTEIDEGNEKRPPLIILSESELPPPPSGPPPGINPDMPPPPPPPWEPKPDMTRNSIPHSATSTIQEATRNVTEGRDSRSRGDRRWRSRRFFRPPWMSEEQYKQLLEKKGLHGFVLVMSTDAMNTIITKDFYMRLLMIAVATIAAVGVGFAWRNFQRSAQLQLRLIRAREMNDHLREMNIAAAGLAHETRNPLNLVRGLAQMISSREEAQPEIKRQALDITEEVDRVAARLNEFIEYSRPPETRPSPRHLNAVIRDVERTLETDKEEKSVTMTISGPEIIVEADEPTLRQIIFNLFLNAIQAVPEGGVIDVVIEENDQHEASLEVRDNGPGVPEEFRQLIFRPYFTTHESGTGLGLAVVRQMVLANGWEIEYNPNTNGGAVFRIQGIKVISKMT